MERYAVEAKRQSLFPYDPHVSTVALWLFDTKEEAQEFSDWSYEQSKWDENVSWRYPVRKARPDDTEFA